MLSVNAQQKNGQEVKSEKLNTPSNIKLSYKIIKSINNTYCYDVYANGKMMIHQPSVPGLSGNEGFKTKLAAQQVAQLVINKIKKGEMPPSVTIDEMKKLKAIP